MQVGIGLTWLKKTAVVVSAVTELRDPQQIE